MKFRWIISLVLSAGLVFIPALTTSAAPAPIGPAGGGFSFLHGVTTMVASDNVAGANFNATRVMCPPGSVAIGGGIDLGNVLTMQVSSSAPVYSQNNNRLIFQPNGANPAPIGWQASAVNTGTGVETYKVSVTCATISGVFSMVTSSSAGSGSFGITSASCPVNTVAYSGGIDLDNLLTMKVTSTGPTFSSGRLLFQPVGNAPAPMGWQASGKNLASSVGQIKVAVICGQNPGITTFIGTGNAGSNNFNAQRLTCPVPMIAIGGGIDPFNVLTMEVSSTAPTFQQNNERLIFQPDGNNPLPVGWQASIVNRDPATQIFNTAVICSLVTYQLNIPFVTR